MGSLHYGTEASTFDDRVLAHLQMAVNTKLRHREGFMMTWIDRTNTDQVVRQAIWIDPSIPLLFRYEASNAPHLKRAWIEHLVESANSPFGLELDDDIRAEIREEIPIGSAKRNRESRRRTATC